jgi:hypothetical protein
MDDFLPKPSDAAQLLAMLAKWTAPRAVQNARSV